MPEDKEFTLFDEFEDWMRRLFCWVTVCDIGELPRWPTCERQSAEESKQSLGRTATSSHLLQVEASGILSADLLRLWVLDPVEDVKNEPNS